MTPVDHDRLATGGFQATLRHAVTVDVEQLRVQVYRTFAETGQPPSVEELAEVLGAETTEVRGGLRQLAQSRHLSLGADDAIVMAHPSSAVPLGFSVMSSDTLWWGGCAWDSFALPHLLGDQMRGAAQVLVATTCPACNRPHAWNVDRSGPPEGEQVAHFLIPAAHMWDNVVHTCGHQRLFCSASCLEAWLARTGNVRGYVLDLGALWRLAAHWYDDRLEYGYTRREPADATDYMRAVGLSGSFWGL